MRIKITGIECDRCGEGVQTTGEETRDLGVSGWARLYAAQLAGNDLVGTSEAPADLCSSCADDLVRFMAGFSVVQPEGAEAAA